MTDTQLSFSNCLRHWKFGDCTTYSNKQQLLNRALDKTYKNILPEVFLQKIFLHHWSFITHLIKHFYHWLYIGLYYQHYRFKHEWDKNFILKELTAYWGTQISWTMRANFVSFVNAIHSCTHWFDTYILLCYGFIVIPPNFICWSSNLQYFRMWPNCERGSLLRY